ESALSEARLANRFSSMSQSVLISTSGSLAKPRLSALPWPRIPIEASTTRSFAPSTRRASPATTAAAASDVAVKRRRLISFRSLAMECLLRPALAFYPSCMPRKRPARPAPAPAPDAPPDSAAALEAALRANAALSDDLRRAKQQLSLRAYELHNLVDPTRNLTSSWAEDAIREIGLTTVMGHFVVSRSALYLVGPDGLALASARGLPRGAEAPPLPSRAL